MCTANCTTRIKDSHLLNGECIADNAKPNDECAPKLGDYSINGVTTECQKNCDDITLPLKTLNTPGYHDLDGKCTTDVGSTPANTACTTPTPGSSMNDVSKECEADCTQGPIATPTIVPTPASHNHNEVCVKDSNPKNAACKTVKANFTVTLGGECVSNCIDVTDATKFVDVNGFHDAAGVCTADTAASTTDNNACMPVKDKFSVNAETQMCTADCTAATKGSHLWNGQCIDDTAKENELCKPTHVEGKSSDSNDNCQPDCKDITDATKTVNTPGFHEDAGTCKADGPPSTDPNDPCDVPKDNYTKNKVSGKCEPDCKDPLDDTRVLPKTVHHQYNGVCYPDKYTDPSLKNGVCLDATKKDSSSVNQLGECVGDCVTKPAGTAPTTSVYMYHDVNGVCTLDIMDDPTSDSNNACTPVTPAKSVNKVKQTCESNCTVKDIKGSHTFNEQCVADTLSDNMACNNPVQGKSVTLAGQCVGDCKNALKETETLNTPGYHEEGTKCTADVAPIYQKNG